MEVTNKIELYDPGRNWRLRYTLQIGSKKIYAKLTELGFTPNKSLILQYPPIPDEYICHFLRGYFDGDGCVSFGYYDRKGRKDKQKVFTIRLRCGSKQFLEELRKELSEKIKTNSGKLYFHSRAYELVYNSRDVIKLYSFIYPTDNVPYLKRKRDILREGIKSFGIEV